MTLFSNFVSADGFCCVLPGACYGNEAAYGGGQGLTQTTCESEAGNTWFTQPCSEIDSCQEGCCIWKQTSGWTSGIVNKNDCYTAYEQSFFVEDANDESSCNSYFSESAFEIFFKILGSDGNLKQIDLDESSVTQIETGSIKEMAYVPSNPDYNYVLSLSYGSYKLEFISGLQSYSGIIDVFQDETFTFRLVTADDVGNIIGKVSNQSGSALENVQVKVSGFSGTVYTDENGNFVFENIPLTEDDLTRTVSYSLDGYILLSKEVNLDIGLTSEANAVLQRTTQEEIDEGKYCCPISLGCSNGEYLSSDVCIVGSGVTGGYCEGSDSVSACAIPPTDCCESELMCDQSNTIAKFNENPGFLACGASAPIGCEATCKNLPICSLNSRIVSPCKCGNSYEDSGYCCEVGNSFFNAEMPCDKITLKVTGVVFGENTFTDSLQKISGANIFIASIGGDYKSYNTVTNGNGIFSIDLPYGSYYLSATAPGFRFAQEIYFSVSGDAGSYYHTIASDNNNNIRTTPCTSNSKSQCADISPYTSLSGWLNLDISQGQYNHIISMSENKKTCSLEKPIDSIKLMPVQGSKALELSWNIDDCSELIWFAISKCGYKRNFDGTINEDSSFCIENYIQLPATERRFIDEDVKWSHLYKSHNGVDVIIPDLENIKNNYDKSNYEVWEYNYTVVPVYGTGIAPNLGKSTSSISVGDRLCEGKTGFASEFCGFTSNPDLQLRADYKLGLRTQRIMCDEYNLIQPTAEIYSHPASCVNSKNAQSYLGNHINPVCFSSFQGSTVCKESPECGSYTFSIVGPFSFFDNANRCYFGSGSIPSNGVPTQQCVFQPDTTVVDTCMNCIEIDSCLDYTSQSACEIDSCHKGFAGPEDTKSARCKWIDTAYSNLGEGICIPTVIPSSSNYCAASSNLNMPFDNNAYWSEELCDEFGDCIADKNVGCVSCDDYKSCSDYNSKYTCEGKDGVSISINYPHGGNSCGGLIETEFGPDKYYNYSTDGCQNLKCSWDDISSKCINDGNDNNIDDYIEARQIGNMYADALVSGDVTFDRTDSVPPLVNPNLNELYFSTVKRDVTFISRELLFFENMEEISSANRDALFGFKYCIDKEGLCCPDKYIESSSYVDGDGISFDLPLIDYIEANNLGDGLYNIRYLAQDFNMNIAPLNSVSVFVDTQRPKFSVELKDITSNDIILGSDPVKSEVFLQIQSLGRVPDIDSIETISCELTLEDLRGNTDYTPVLPLDYADIFAKRHDIKYELSDGVYRLYLTCEDLAGNVNSTYLDVPILGFRVDQVAGFDVINPPVGGVISSLADSSSSARTTLEVVTEISSECSVSFRDSITGTEKSAMLIPQDTDFKTNHKLNLEYESIAGSKAVYDGDFVVSCFEQSAKTGEFTVPLPDQELLFGVDNTPAVTVVEPDVEPFGSEILTQNNFVLRYFFNKNVSFDLSCRDDPVDWNYPNIFAGCDESETKYCIVESPVTELSGCDPTTSYEGDGTLPTLDNDFVICYNSIDKIGNEERVKCISSVLDTIPPTITLDVESPLDSVVSPYGFETYYVNSNEIVFSGSITDNENEIDLNNIVAYVSPASGNAKIPAEIELDSTSGKLQFTGKFSMPSNSLFAFGSNFLVIESYDSYGNKGIGFARFLVDSEEPILKDSVTVKSLDYSGSNVEYGKDLIIDFDIDDVFWTNEINNVGLRLYSYDFDYSVENLAPISNVVVASATENDGAEEELPTDAANIIKYVKNEDDFDNIKKYLSNFAGDDDSVLDSFADWKHFTVELNHGVGEEIELDPITYLSTMNIGEYVLVISAEDAFGQYMEKRVVFNVSDSTPPVINLVEPAYRGTDQKTRYTNDINQVFTVQTDPGAECYFDFGSRATQANKMIPDASKSIHRYVLNNFEPELNAKIPFVITCSEHGTDMNSENYLLVFDRTPLSLELKVENGISPVIALQKHVSEYSFDYNSFDFGGSTDVSVIETSGKSITCSYTCRSPNSQCPSASGLFYPKGSFNAGDYSSSVMQSMSLIGRTSDGNKYSWGDYIFDIVCEDESGNVGKTNDLSLSVRTPSAPQELFIIDATPTGKVYDDDVNLKVVTNMISDCRYTFEGKPSLGNSNLMSENSRLTHSVDINLSEEGPGVYTVRFDCAVANDISKTESKKIIFEIPKDLSIGSLYQRYDAMPVLQPKGIDGDVVRYEYSFSESDLLSGNGINSYNPYFIAIHDAKPDSTVFVRSFGDNGQYSVPVNFTFDSDYKEMSAARLDYVFAAQGDFSRPVSAVDGVYSFTEEDLILSFSFRADAGANILLYVDEDSIATSSIQNHKFDAAAGSYSGRLKLLPDGYHDIFVIIKHSDGLSDEYIHVMFDRSSGAPRILSVTPEYMSGNQITIDVSKPSVCYALYPSDSRKGQSTTDASDYGVSHTLTLNDLVTSKESSSVSYITVVCGDGIGNVDSYNHLVRVDTKSPRINNLESDNSIVRSSNSGITTFTVLRDEDAHVIVNMDEYGKCTYTSSDGSVTVFDDYFMPNLHPHVALPASETKSSYTIKCYDAAGNPSGERKVDVVKDINAAVYIHDAYPIGPVPVSLPELEVFTYREAECFIGLEELSNPDSTGVFASIGKALGGLFFTRSISLETENVGHRYRHSAIISSTGGTTQSGLEKDVHYKAKITCRSKQAPSSSYEIEFWYDGTAGSRPQIYVES